MIAMLTLIREVAYNIKLEQYLFMVQHSALQNFLNYKQSYHMTNDPYYEGF